MSDNCWLTPEGKCLEEIPSGFVGFIYKITTDPGTEKEKFYIGKKLFEFSKKKKITKKVKKETGTRKRIERTKIESDWKDYFGSSKKLIEYLETVGYDKCKREVLLYCKTKTDLSYYETFVQMGEGVLFREDSWNDHIGNYYRGKVTELLDNQIEGDGIF